MSRIDDEYVIFEKDIRCTCGSEIVKLTKWKDEDFYFVSFYYHQPPAPLYYQLWERIKFAIKVLRGKDHCFSEIVLDTSDIKRLAADLQKHLESEAPK